MNISKILLIVATVFGVLGMYFLLTEPNNYSTIKFYNPDEILCLLLAILCLVIRFLLRDKEL